MLSSAARYAIRRTAAMTKLSSRTIGATTRTFHARVLGARREKRVPRVGMQHTRFMSVSTMNVPDMGDSITEGTIAGWSKAVGEYVEIDEVPSP